MIKEVLRQTKRQLREDMIGGWYGQENERLALVAKASRKGSKEQRAEALRLMKERYNISGKLEDFNYVELDIFYQFMEYLDDIAEAATEI